MYTPAIAATDLSTVKAQTPADKAIVCLYGESSAGDIPVRFYYYDASATDTGDDYNVIEPTSGTGRYLLIDSRNAQKQIETHSGETDGSGLLSITFDQPFAVAPTVYAVIVGAAVNQLVRITSISTTGCTVHAYKPGSAYLSLLGLNLLSENTVNIASATIEVLAIEK